MQREIEAAYLAIRKNDGSSGVDQQSLADFTEDEENQIYLLWNRMSSGTYFPVAVRRVEIPKKDGGKRPPGILTARDRIVQKVVASRWELIVEHHEDSYGYRAKRNAHEAVETCSLRCWKYDWVLDVDIQGCFENIPHDWLLKIVRKTMRDKHYRGCAMDLLYIERWLTAPVQMPDGTLQEKTPGVPQGGCISSLLSNMFLNHVLYQWMARKYPSIPFERYADDVVCHGKTEAQARYLLHVMTQRTQQWGLTLHPHYGCPLRLARRRRGASEDIRG